jgi:transcriptional regulator with AAA-type ATPase domain/ferredoxin
MLSERIRQSNLRVEDSIDRASVLESFMAQQAQLSADELVGTSRAIRVLTGAIEDAAGCDRPILIEGEPGSGRSLAAQLIHKKSAKREGVLLTLDCNRIPPLSSSATGQQSNQDPLLDELAQLSALFGHKKEAFSFAPTRRLGHVEVASAGTLVIKNIDRLHLKVQSRLAGFLRSGQFFPLGDATGSYSQARIIATTSVDLKAGCEAGQFDRELYELLAEHKISVPPLRARKADIKLLVDYLISKHSRQLAKDVQGIAQGALNMLLSHDWPENVNELQRVIQRAVVLTRDGIVNPEVIFIGIVPFQSEGQFNLFNFAAIRAALKNKLFPLLLHPLTVAFLGMAIILGLLGPQSPDKNVSLVLIWGIWWPFLVFSLLLAARLWCALCPLAALANWVSRLVNLDLKVPQFIRKYGPYLSVAGFGLIIWLEQATHMSRSPSATAYLLLSILAGAVISGILFERRAWCRYLCPLGAFAGTFATMSALSLRANTNVCRNECTNHECYVGEGDIKGCPMYQGAFSIQTNQHCTLCGNCVKLCPNESPRLNLRIPGNELWTVPQLTLTAAVFVPVIMGSIFVRILENTPAFGSAVSLLGGSYYMATLILLIVATALSFGVVSISSQTVSKPAKNDFSSRFVWAAYAFLPLAFAGELSYQLSILIFQGSHLPAQLGRFLGLNLEGLAIQTSPLLVAGIWLALLLPGVGGTLYVARQLVKRQAQGRRFRFGVAFAIALLYLGLSVYGL